MRIRVPRLLGKETFSEIAAAGWLSIFVDVSTKGLATPSVDGVDCAAPWKGIKTAAVNRILINVILLSLVNIKTI